jgi:hypothetical protein
VKKEHTMHTRLHWMATAVFAGALLTACGGGGGDAPAASITEVPDSALVSAASYTAFAVSLGIDESAEPLGTDRVVAPPTSETDEPASLN